MATQPQESAQEKHERKIDQFLAETTQGWTLHNGKKIPPSAHLVTYRILREKEWHGITYAAYPLLTKKLHEKG